MISPEAVSQGILPRVTAREAVAEAHRMLRIVGKRGGRVTVNPTTLGPEVDRFTMTMGVPVNPNGRTTPKFTRATTIGAISTLRTERALD